MAGLSNETYGKPQPEPDPEPVTEPVVSPATEWQVTPDTPDPEAPDPTGRRR